MDIINRFYIESFQIVGDQVFFFMEDTCDFELWLRDYEISYTMKYLTDNPLDQIIISVKDYYNKVEKHTYDDNKKAEILKVVIKNVFGLEGTLINELAEQNANIVFVGESKDPHLYTISSVHNEIVSIDSDKLQKIFDAIQMALTTK